MGERLLLKLIPAYRITGALTLTSVKILKKVMPEQIKTSAQNKTASREAHDFANLFTVNGLIAVDRALFTDRLRIERTAAPPGDGIVEEFTATITEPA